MITRILHIADLHFGREDARLVEALAEMERELSPDVVVASGDLTTFGKRSEFAAARPRGRSTAQRGGAGAAAAERT